MPNYFSPNHIWLLKLELSVIEISVSQKGVKPQHLLMSGFRFFFTFGPFIFPLFFRPQLCIKIMLIIFHTIFLGVFSSRIFIIYYLPYYQKQKHWIFAIPPGLVIWFIKAHQLESSDSRGELTVSKSVHFLRNSKELKNSEKYRYRLK